MLRPSLAAATSQASVGEMAALRPGRHLPPYFWDADEELGQCGAGPGTMCVLCLHVPILFGPQHACQSQEQLVVLLPPCGFWELDSGQQAASSTVCHVAVESLLSRIRERFAAQQEEREHQLNSVRDSSVSLASLWLGVGFRGKQQLFTSWRSV